MTIPVQWHSVPEWQRLAALAVNEIERRTQFVGTVAQLPTVAQGLRGMVTDSNTTTFAAVVAGGGSNVVPVYCDGTNWRVG